jgi:hypothetical protein
VRLVAPLGTSRPSRSRGPRYVRPVTAHSETETIRLVHELATAVSPLRESLREHVSYHGEVIAYVVFADFRGLLADMVENGDENNITQFLDVVERWSGARSDPAHGYGGAARNMIAVALLEDGLIHSGGRELLLLNALRSRFGPQTRELLAETEANIRAAGQ